MYFWTSCQESRCTNRSPRLKNIAALNLTEVNKYKKEFCTCHRKHRPTVCECWKWICESCLRPTSCEENQQMLHCLGSGSWLFSQGVSVVILNIQRRGFDLHVHCNRTYTLFSASKGDRVCNANFDRLCFSNEEGFKWRLHTKTRPFYRSVFVTWRCRRFFLETHSFNFSEFSCTESSMARKG